MAKRTRTVETITHDDASRKNIPTAEYHSVMEKADQSPIQVAYERRNRDLDPQLVWRGKDEQDWSDLVVQAPPLFIQEKVHPKVLIDDLLRRSKAGEQCADDQLDLFADFNGVPDDNARTEFYRHDANWSNRMILGDSLQVMASLAEREGLRGKVQCIYLDPPYGIKFNSNFQWSTTSRDVKDGKAEHITREPEQVKAFRDTWRDGIHSYLTYLRDRLTVARDLLSESGTIFVQIGNENVHRIRALMDEILGRENYIGTIVFQKTGSIDQSLIPQTVDYLLVFARNIDRVKYRQAYIEREPGTTALERYDMVLMQDGTTRRITSEEATSGQVKEAVRCRLTSLSSARPRGEGDLRSFAYEGVEYTPGTGTFKSNLEGLTRLAAAGRLRAGRRALTYLRRVDDFRVVPLSDYWESVQIGTGLTYVVQTSIKVVQRCILMATDPGDLVLDPTCGSGTTAYVAEQWGRRWITIDTSRVALALARSRVMGARYPYYLLADSEAGRQKEAELTRSVPSDSPTGGDIQQGFVYERVPHITLKSIANNAEIDVICERWQETLEPLRTELNTALGRTWEEWQIPCEPGDPWPDAAAAAWKRLQTAQTNGAKTAALRALNGALRRNYTIDEVPDQPRDPWDAGPTDLHRRWWEARIARQETVDGSIAAKADYEYLYDRPYDDRGIVRVAGPFTVESLSPHRTLGVDENDELIDHLAESKADYDVQQDFATTILEHLKTSGVQQAHKEDRIGFTALTPWPGHWICAEGRYVEGDAEAGAERRAGIFIGPEFGTVSRPDLVEAVREAADADYDVLIACAFSYDAHASEFSKLGRIPVLKARMNADLHMAGDLKNTGKGNLFVIFGEPDIDILPVQTDGDQPARIQVKVNGVDVFHPNTGEIRSDGPDGIACWFIDTDYNEESFFVRHAYFLGANDPYKALKTTLKAEIHRDAWQTLHSDTSRPFHRPASGRIAVKVINHLGDEVMKVFRV